MKKNQYLYPAIFVKSEGGSYQVLFPDLGIYTDGSNLSEAYVYAKALLKAYFTYVVKYDTEFNQPSKLEKFAAKCKENEIVMFVDAVIDVKE